MVVRINIYHYSDLFIYVLINSRETKIHNDYGICMYAN